MRLLLLICLLSLSAIAVTREAAADCRDQVEALFASFTVVDGYRGLRSRDVGTFTRDTGVNITAVTSPAFDQGRQLELLDRFTRAQGARVIISRDDLDAAERDGDVGVIFYLQKPNPHGPSARSADLVERWAYLGYRIMQLFYDDEDNQRLSFNPYIKLTRNRLVGNVIKIGTYELTLTGRATVEALIDQGILVDVSHIPEEASIQIAEIAKRRGVPITANHALTASVHPIRRNKSDREIYAIAGTGGVIGLTPIGFMAGRKANGPGLHSNVFVDHLRHVLELDCRNATGDRLDMSRHVGVAGDTGADGWERSTPFYFNERFNHERRWPLFAEHLCQMADASLYRRMQIDPSETLRPGIASRTGFPAGTPLLPPGKITDQLQEAAQTTARRNEFFKRLFGGNFMRVYRQVF